MRLDGRGEHRLEELTHQAVRKVALQLPASGLQHSHSPARGDFRGGLEQRGLADPGGALDDNQPARGALSVPDRGPQAGELAFALQELLDRGLLRARPR
jgi:hypothetical protein